MVVDIVIYIDKMNLKEYNNINYKKQNYIEKL